MTERCRLPGPSSLKHTLQSLPSQRVNAAAPSTLMAEGDDATTPRTDDAECAADPCPRSLLIGSCVAASCVGVEYGLIYPTIYPYLRELGAHPTVVTGVAAAAFSLAKTAAFVPLGAAADRFGPRKPAVVAFLVAAIGNVYYFAASRPLDVVVARAIVGLGSSVTGVLLGVVGSGNCEDASSRRKRDLRLAVFNGTSLLAVLAGPGLAALFSFLPEGDHEVLSVDAYSAPGLFLAALALLCAVWALLALPATPPAQRSSRRVGEAVIERNVSVKPARDVRDALITRRGAATLTVSFVGGSMIACLDTAFPVVARDDFQATTTTISLVLACFALLGVFAMVLAMGYAKKNDGDPGVARKRKVRVVRVGLSFEVIGALTGLLAFLYVPPSHIFAREVFGLASGALIILGALSASNANIQLLAAVADMGHHPGFYAGLRSVFVCAGRSVGALSAGWLVAVSSKTYLPVFAFVVGVASLGLFVFMVAPPRLVGGSDLAEPLLEGEAAAAPV